MLVGRVPLLTWQRGSSLPGAHELLFTYNYPLIDCSAGKHVDPGCMTVELGVWYFQDVNLNTQLI